MITKEKLIETIKAMPEDKFEDIDVLIQRIFFLEKIENGIKDIDSANYISNDAMKTEIQEWFRK